MNQQPMPVDPPNQTPAVSSEQGGSAAQVANEARKAAVSKIGAGKDFAAENLGSLAQALHKTGQELQSQQSAASEYVEKAASSIEKVSEYFQTRTLSQVAGDLQSFARREPALYLGGAFLAGLLGGRLLKVSAPRRDFAARDRERDDVGVRRDVRDVENEEIVAREYVVLPSGMTGEEPGEGQ